MSIKKIYIILFLFLSSISWGQVPGPYVLADFSEKDLGKMLEICRQGGFEYLIQKTPFSTYGHYNWNEAFAPQGETSVKRMTRRSRNSYILSPRKVTWTPIGLPRRSLKLLTS